MLVSRAMAEHEQIIIKVEKLPDGSTTIRAHSEGTGRVLLDRVYITRGGFEHGIIHVTPDGLAWELA